jgi:CDP-diacylglycerol--glycerol-3-phosphate 3-phosphatidyltransferase
MIFSAKQLLYPGNLLSLLRLALAVPVTYLAARPELGRDGLLMAILVVVIASDWLDGYLSRKLNQTTELGKLLDPIADKTVMAGGILALVLGRGFPVIVVFLLLYRDAVILILGTIVSRRMGKITSSNMLGKLTTTLFAAACLLYVPAPEFTLTRLLIWAAAAGTVISGIAYYRFGESYLAQSTAAKWTLRVVLVVAPLGLWRLL